MHDCTCTCTCIYKYILTRGAVLYGSVVDVVSELLHVSAVFAVDYVHYRADTSVGKTVGTATVQVSQPRL